MNFDEFKLYVSEAVTSALGDDYEYTHTQVIKNNGIRLTGLSVHRTGNTISPTFYLEGFYESYKKGESLKSIIDTLAEGYSRYEIEEAPDLDFITDYEEVSKRIMIKLVNYEKNKDFLCEAPYVKIMDLAAVFYVEIKHKMMGEGAIMIRNSCFEKWGADIDTVYKDAFNNTRNILGCEISNITEVLKNIILSKGGDDSEVDELLSRLSTPEDIPMYILSNKTGHFGASCMLYEDMLKSFADKMENDLYILPSSIHELIIIPDSGKEEPDNLRMMVKQVNSEQLEPGEVLSDNVYYFERKQGKVRLACTA